MVLYKTPKVKDVIKLHNNIWGEKVKEEVEEKFDAQNGDIREEWLHIIDMFIDKTHNIGYIDNISKNKYSQSQINKLYVEMVNFKKKYNL